MSTVNAVEVIAEALAKHPYRGQDHCTIAFRSHCHCTWTQDVAGSHKSELELHAAHQAAVIAALPNIAIVPNEHRAETRQWDGTRASIEALCRWANPESDPMDDATLTYTHFGSDDVCEVDMVGPSGYESVTAGDWIVRTSNGEFLLARGTLAAAGGES